MDKSRRKYRLIFLLTVLPAFLWMEASFISNTHTHILPDGQIVVHAHPLGDNTKPDSENHTHSSSDLVFWTVISNFFLSDSSADYFLNKLYFSEYKSSFAPAALLIEQNTRNIKTPRAPPLVGFYFV